MVGVNPFKFSDEVQEVLVDPENWDFLQPEAEPSFYLPQESFLVVDRLLPAAMAHQMCTVIQNHEWLSVGLDGFAGKPFEQVGNYRLSTYNVEISDMLWERLKGFLPQVRVMDEFTPTDHDGHSHWKPVGVSPLLRFIRYKEGGQLVAHYDATYKESEERRTLMSLVIYLTKTETGATRFIRDPQRGKAMSKMDFSDWDRSANSDEVIFESLPEVGKAIIFDHRLLHDGQPLAEGSSEKIIIRTDIMFEKV